MRLEISVHLKRWAKRSIEKGKGTMFMSMKTYGDKEGSIENDETTKTKCSGRHSLLNRPTKTDERQWIIYIECIYSSYGIIPSGGASREEICKNKCLFWS